MTISNAPEPEDVQNEGPNAATTSAQGSSKVKGAGKTSKKKSTTKAKEQPKSAAIITSDQDESDDDQGQVAQPSADKAPTPPEHAPTPPEPAPETPCPLWTNVYPSTYVLPAPAFSSPIIPAEREINIYYDNRKTCLEALSSPIPGTAQDVQKQLKYLDQKFQATMTVDGWPAFEERIELVNSVVGSAAELANDFAEKFCASDMGVSMVASAGAMFGTSIQVK